MLGIESIIQCVSNVGFPVVMCLVCCYYVKFMSEQHKAEITMLNEQHKTDMKEFTKAINNNTLAISKLTEKIK